MRIGIDSSRAIVKEGTGIENYSRFLIEAMLKVDKRNNYILFVPETCEIPKEFAAAKVQFLPRRKIWTHQVLGPAAQNAGLDVFFVPSHVVPFNYKGKVVTTIHDCAFAYFPKAYSLFSRFYNQWAVKSALYKCQRLIVPSNSTKNDLLSLYGAEKEKVAVVYHGANFLPREKKTAEEPYFLFVGRIEERKNVRGLILSFKVLKDRFKVPHKLYIVGKTGYGAKPIFKLVDELGLEKDIVFSGYLPNDKLAEVYQKADLFLFPTLYEGFGLPVLEAFANGVPVICSDIPVLREIAGNAAVFVNPANPFEIATFVFAVLKDAKMQKYLIKEGRERLKLFSWEKCAQETIRILEEAANL